MATQQEIQTAINNLTSSSTVEEMFILAADTNGITQDRIISVPTVNDLPDLGTTFIATGTIYFVDQYKSIVYSQGNKWVGVDGRLLRRDFFAGQVWGWGCGYAGALGDGTVSHKSSPISTIGGLTDWCQVSIGSFTTAAVRRNGTLWAWGRGNQGHLGDNTVVNKSSPVSVVGGFTDWCQVSAGSGHTAAVRQNGTLWTWGYNGSGRLGINDNTNSCRSSPVSVVGGFTDWCQVSASAVHTAAVRQNGTLWAWGANNLGRLGDGTTTSRSSPVSVVGGFTDWCQVSAGAFHTTAVRQNGTVWAWGYGTAGQLGDNTAAAKISPVSVVGGFTDWCQVSAGIYHTAAVRQNGTLWAWGCNSFGRLGDNTSINKSSPVSVVGGFTDWCNVGAGGYHTAAVRQNGTLWSWGNNSIGQLGINSTVSRSSPVSLCGGGTDWCRVSGGQWSTVALRAVA